MKTLIAILTIFFSVQSFAAPQSFELQEGDQFLSAMDGHVTVGHRAPRCPLGALCAPETFVSIQYNLMGCMDSKISTHKVVYNEDGTFDIYVSALNVFNKMSLVAFCASMPVEFDNIFVAPGFVGKEQIRVHFLGVEENN